MKIHLNIYQDVPLKLRESTGLCSLTHASSATRNIVESTFLDNSRMYNSMLSFTSMGGAINHSIMDGHIPYYFRINGNNYHRIGSLLLT